jgi:hypothetical protein
VLGPDGALKLIQSNGAQTAASLLPKAAAANRPIFYDGEGHARSPSQVLAKLSLGHSVHGAISEPKPAQMIQWGNTASAVTDWTEEFTADLWALAMKAYGRPKDE